MDMPAEPYAARLSIDHPERLDRLTTLLRVIWIIPIAIVYGLLTATWTETVVNAAGEQVQTISGGIASGLFLATVLMISWPPNEPE